MDWRMWLKPEANRLQRGSISSEEHGRVSRLTHQLSHSLPMRNNKVLFFREKRWKNNFHLVYCTLQGFKNFLWFKKPAFGCSPCQVGRRGKVVGVQEMQMHRKSSSNVHGNLVEKLWVEIGTRFIFQTRTYTNPRLPIIWKRGGICLSIYPHWLLLCMCAFNNENRHMIITARTPVTDHTFMHT